MRDDLVARSARALERLVMIAAMNLAGKLGEETDLAEKASRLRRCGFSNSEIADVLNTTANSVGVALHKHRRSKRAKRATGRTRD